MKSFFAAILVLAVIGLGAPAQAQAASAGAVQAQKQCSACHLFYPPVLLPARSWVLITSHLSHHFGEDASLDPKTTKLITAFLVANAADSPNGNPNVLWHVPPNVTPARITDMPFWRDIHADLLRPGVGTGPGIRTAANCARCHRIGGGGGDN